VSSLVGPQKDLRSVVAFRTDGKEPFADAFSHEFTSAVKLTCFIWNTETKLKEIGFATDCQHQILDDLFGKCSGETMFEGFFDSTDVDTFNSKLDS